MHKCKRCTQASNFHTRAHNHSVFHADNDTPLSRPKHLLIMMGNCRLPQRSCWARGPRRTTGVHVFSTGTTAGRSARANSKWRKTTSRFRRGLLKALKSWWRSCLEQLFSIGFIFKNLSLKKLFHYIVFCECVCVCAVVYGCKKFSTEPYRLRKKLYFFKCSES